MIPFKSSDIDMFKKFRCWELVEELGALGPRRVSHKEAESLGAYLENRTLDGILYPYSIEGEMVYFRIRRDNIENGKYIAPPGSNRKYKRTFYRLPDTDNLLQDTSVPIIIVEAEKSVLAVSALYRRLGLPVLVLAVGGDWGWRHGGAKPLPLPDFDTIKWKGRAVTVCFDTNVTDNEDVQRAERALLKELVGRGAHALPARIPKEPGVNGPDDYIAAHINDGEFPHMLQHENEEAQLWELAALVPTEYETVRKDKAKNLGWRVSFLDREVDARRVKKGHGANLASAVKILTKSGRDIWYDEFASRVMVDGKPLTDAAEIAIATWIGEEYGITQMSVDLVGKAIKHVAQQNKRNPPQEWLNSLRWDGVDRLETFFKDHFGAEDNKYTRAVSKNFWISFVARILEPGCQADNMIVLEGPQGGQKKTSALLAIGGDWFAEQKHSPNDKDFFVTMQGKALVEIGELDAFSRAGIAKVKQTITCRTDRYRNPYDRYAQDHPRQGIFAGTTNRTDWNHDETGARRFWPIACRGEIDIPGILRDREQLFAEAVHRYKAKETYWETPEDETLREQNARYEEDVWAPKVMDYIKGLNENRLKVVDILTDEDGPFKMTIDRVDKKMQGRITQILQSIGWKARHTKNGNVWEPTDKAKVFAAAETERVVATPASPAA